MKDINIYVDSRTNTAQVDQNVNTLASTNISNQPVMLTTAELENTTTEVSEESEAE